MPRIARITGVADRLEIAEVAAESVLSDQSATPLWALQANAGLAMLAVQKGDQSAAAAQYDYFLEHRGTMIWTVSSADHLLGLLAQTMGNNDQATVHFEDAISFCRKAGSRPELAWTCYDYADALLQRNKAGDRGNATSLLDESLAIASELVMHPLMARVTERLERVCSEPVAAPAYPDSLTRREVEVLRLIAVGKSNREISEELIITLNTVFRHVSNIFTKIGAANRTEAAEYATRHGLVPG